MTTPSSGSDQQDGQPSAVELGKANAPVPAYQPSAPAPYAPPRPPAYPGGPGGPGMSYGYQSQPGQPVAFGLAMKRRNPVGVWIGLPLITLGIYVYVWYYKIHKEMSEFDRRRNIPVAGPMLVLLFLYWTLIAPIISFNNAGRRIRNAQVAAGMQPTCSPAVCWLLMFVFGLNTLYMQVQLNKIVDRYQGASPGAQVPLFA